MKKTLLAVVAIFDGLLVIAAITAFILGFIHSISTSAEYALLMLTPAPVIWIHFRLNKICSRLNGTEEGENGGKNE